MAIVAFRNSCSIGEVTDIAQLSLRTALPSPLGQGSTGSLERVRCFLHRRHSLDGGERRVGVRIQLVSYLIPYLHHVARGESKHR